MTRQASDRGARLRAWRLVGLAAALVIWCVPALGQEIAPAAKSRKDWKPESPSDPPRRPGPVRTTPPGFSRLGPFNSVQVNVDPEGDNISDDAANEPSIAVDPTNPSRMAIGWRQFDSVLSNFREGGYGYSVDAGRTWTFPGVLQQNFFRSDPVLASSPDGEFYYNSLEAGFLIDVFRSTDGGKTWPVSAPAFGGDKAWMVVDQTDGIGRGNIYCSWSVFAGCCQNRIFTRSTDCGVTWMEPIQVPTSPIFGTLAVGPDGEVYVAGVNPNDFGQFRIARSTNAKDPSVTPTFDLTATVDMRGVLTLAAGPNPDGLLGQVWVAVDRSGGPRNGWVYMLCSVDPPNSDPLNVKLSRSTDGGATWSTTVTINTDMVTGTYQWFGTMSVAPNGRIDVIWNDNRANQFQFDSQVFYSFSEDGGFTWSANTAVSVDFDPHVGFPQQNKIGDYYHMISDNVGANLAYAATFNDEQDVYFLRIGDYDCNGNGVSDAVDLSSAAATDFNGNAIPDSCDGLGDLNCDDRVDQLDVGPMVLALIDGPAYAQQFPGCPLPKRDVDGNGALDSRDLQGFAYLLTAP